MALCANASADLAAAFATGRDRGPWFQHTELAHNLLSDDPGTIITALQAAAFEGASCADLGRSLGYAAALRVAQFGTANEHGDWETAHHVFTYCNAVHQVLKRIGGDPEHVADFVEASRAVLHGALAIYLIRYLNVPPARLPALGDDRLESMPSTIEEIRFALLDAFDRQHQIDAAANSCGAPSHVGPSAKFSHFRLGTCSVARGRRLPCLSNVRGWGASVRRMGKHGTWTAYPRRGCSLPRSALSNRARLAANSRHRSSAIKRRPASCGRAAGASMMRRIDGHRDGAFHRTEHCKTSANAQQSACITEWGAFALTDILIDLTILSGQSARYPGSSCRSAGLGPYRSVIDRFPKERMRHDSTFDTSCSRAGAGLHRGFFRRPDRHLARRPRDKCRRPHATRHGEWDCPSGLQIGGRGWAKGRTEVSTPQSAAFRAITHSHRRPAARADMPRTPGRKKPAIRNKASFVKPKRGRGAKEWMPRATQGGSDEVESPARPALVNGVVDEIEGISADAFQARSIERIAFGAAGHLRADVKHGPASALY